MSNNFDGPLLLDDITKYFGFGRTGFETESFGPRIYAVDADPNGVLTAIAGSIALRYSGTVAVYQCSGGTTWTLVAGPASSPASGLSVVRKRLTLADIDVPGMTQTGSFADSIPANAVVIGASCYVATAPTGPGLGSFTLTVRPLITDPTIIELQQLFGATVGYQDLNANPALLSATNQVNLAAAARIPFWNVAADIALEDVTALDATAYIFYVATPQGGALP